MVKGWIKLVVVLFTGAFCVGLPVTQGISWSAPTAYIWWVFVFHLTVFAISVFLGALTNARLTPSKLWWFLAHVGCFLGTALGASKLNRLITTANDWPYGGTATMTAMAGFILCGQLWRPDFLNPYTKPTPPPVPSQPKA